MLARLCPNLNESPAITTHADSQQWCLGELPNAKSLTLARSITNPGPEQRQSDFDTGRRCLHQLLQHHFGEYRRVKVGVNREPLWPNGFIGSLSHSPNWVWAVVAQKTSYQSLGIDTEQMVLSATAAELRTSVGEDAEWQLIGELNYDPDLQFTLLFSAKEAYYKAWYPLVQTFFDFSAAQLVAVESSALWLQPSADSPVAAINGAPQRVPFLVSETSSIDVFTMTTTLPSTSLSSEQS